MKSVYILYDIYCMMLLILACQSGNCGSVNNLCGSLALPAGIDGEAELFTGLFGKSARDERAIGQRVVGGLLTKALSGARKRHGKCADLEMPTRTSLTTQPGGVPALRI